MKKYLPICLCLLLFSCLSIQSDPFARRARLSVMYEKGFSESNIPECAVLYMDRMHSGATINSIDGKSHENYAGKIYLKAGKRSIRFFGSSYYGNYQYSGYSTMEYVFEAGKEYEASAMMDTLNKKFIVNIELVPPAPME